ncbi:MAG: hypothetical protein AABY15_05560 [Nanoarchaeota archaeon]
MENKQSFIKKVLGMMKESSYDKKGGKISSGRLSSYFILAVIVGAATTFIGIDIVNAIMAIINKGFYEVPANHIVLYGMTLAHHLTLLGINKNSETKIEQAVQDKLKSLKKEEPKKSAEEEIKEEDV